MPAEPSSEVARLARAFRGYLAERSEAPAAECQEERLQAVCLTLLLARPGEPGDAVSADLRAGEHDLAEARVCRLWLDREDPAADGEERLLGLAAGPLWPPVRALAHRTLVHLGRRAALAGLLPPAGGLSLAEADVRLDAAHADELDPGWAERIAPPGDPLLPEEVSRRWGALLDAEAAVARGDGAAVERVLEELASGTLEETPGSYGRAEAERIAARAAAALARLRLGRGGDALSVLGSSAAEWLPSWERGWLLGLAWWRLGHLKRARCELEAALAQNPRQNSIRLALASLLAPDAPEAALAVLEPAELTREVRGARAALLARLGNDEGAGRVLETAKGAAALPWEPERCRWPGGRERVFRQEAALRTALAERSGQWALAGAEWGACPGVPPALRKAREAYQAGREVEGLAGRQGWRRSVLRNRWESGLQEAARRPVVGEAAFFYAMAALETMPERAAGWFKALLRRRGWIDAERRWGGRRLLAAGDALLRLGEPAEAARAYEALPGNARTEETRERAAVAGLQAALSGGLERCPLAAAAMRAAESAPGASFPELLAALALLVAGNPESARSRLDAAGEQAGLAAVTRCFQALAKARTSGEAVLSEEEIAAPGMPEPAAAAVRLLCGIGPEVERIEAFIAAAGEDWTRSCPVDPERAVRRLLAALCREGRWDAARRVAEMLHASGLPWAEELALLVHARAAVERALRGEFDGTERTHIGVEWRQAGPGPREGE